MDRADQRHSGATAEDRRPASAGRRGCALLGEWPRRRADRVGRAFHPDPALSEVDHDADMAIPQLRRKPLIGRTADRTPDPCLVRRTAGGGRRPPALRVRHGRVGLAAAGYAARAQDASTVFTNPAGMTRLEGTQVPRRRAGHVAETSTSPSAAERPPDWATTAAARSARMASCPEAARSSSLQLLAGSEARLRGDRQLRLAHHYDDNWVGRYYVQENAARRLVRAVDRLPRERQAVARLEPERDVRQARPEGRDQQHRRRRRPARARRQELGVRRQRRHALRVRPGHARLAHLQLAGRSSTSRRRPSSPGWVLWLQNVLGVARPARRERGRRRRRPATGDGQHLPPGRRSLDGARQRRLAAVVEVRPGARSASNSQQPDESHHQPRLQGHLARGRRRAVPDQPDRGCSTSASRYDSAFQDRVERYAVAAGQLRVAFRRGRAEAGEQDAEVGYCRRTPYGGTLDVNRQPAASRARRTRQSRRFVRQHDIARRLGLRQLGVLNRCTSIIPRIIQ